MNRALPAVRSLSILVLLAASASAQEWVWSGPKGKAKANEVVHFRKAFEVKGKVSNAQLIATCDNAMTVHLNGKVVAQSEDWQKLAVVRVKRHLKAGRNVLAVRGKNDGGTMAGFILWLNIELAGGKKQNIVTDKSWRIAAKAPKGWEAPNFDDGTWTAAVSLGKWGIAPWGTPSGRGGRSPASGKATDPKTLKLPADFRIELVYTVPKAEQGSWVSLTRAPGGTLITCDQGGSLYRVTPAPIGEPEDKTGVERMDLPVGRAHGILWAFDSLYVHGGGFHRVRDSDGDGQLDKAEKVMDVRGGGEHGPHGIIVSEDGKSLYVAAGNHTPLPAIRGGRMSTKWSEDLLLPRQWDARGHARGKLAPGGWVCKVDPEGKNWEVYSVGYRNQYDIALNRHGEMFTFDADMEWDMGMPWYRPTRVCHVVSGSEFGWRSGTGKWPVYYEDSLPATLDIGPGSPTGVVFGTGAKFPTKYQDALYILDWTFGTIWAVHLTPNGASYTADKEPFVTGMPLPVTDAVIGEDGALYFAIGGRGTQSALYRVTYTGSASTAPPTAVDPAAAKARALRRSLEAYHGRRDPGALDAAWPHLGNKDRFIRYAARLAVEAQPVGEWKSRALAETDPQAKVTALVALARMDAEASRGDIVESLLKLDPKALPQSPLLGMLRATALAFARGGRPEAAEAARIVARLDPLLPAGSDEVNTELVRVLVYLDSPTVVEKTLKLIAAAKPARIPDWAETITRNRGYGGTIRKMLDNHPPLQKIQYAFMIRNVRFGWAMDQRKAYFTFINEAAKHPGGASYGGFLKNIRADALKNCSKAERAELASITGESLTPPPEFKVVPVKGPGKKWTIEAAMKAVGSGLRGRSFENGRNAYYATGCAKCHRFDGAGGAIGPDLSSVGSRFSDRDLLESLIEPSKVISDQYGSSIVRLKEGGGVRGLVVDTSEGKADGILTVYTSDLNAPPVKVKKSDIESIKPSPVSQMPENLLDVLNREELLDLLAFLRSRGDSKGPAFKK